MNFYLINCKHWITKLIQLVLVFCVVTNAEAAPVASWKGMTYLLPAGEHDIRIVFRNFQKAAGLSVELAPEINGSVSGTGEAVPLQEFVETLAFRQSLNWFVFRNVLYVSRNKDSVEARIQVPTGELTSLRAALTSMQLLNDKFPITELPSQQQLLIFGPPTYIKLVRQQITKIRAVPADSLTKTERPEPMVFRLRYGSAVDRQIPSERGPVTRPGIASILLSLYQSKNGLGRRKNAQPVDNRRQAAKTYPTGAPGMTLRPTGKFSNGESPTVPAIAPMGMVPSLMSRLQRPNERSDFPEEMPIEGDVPSDALSDPDRQERADSPPRDDSPLIEADPRLNAVIVRDKPSRREEYARLIASLDVPVEQLSIEAVIVEMSKDDLARAFATLPSRSRGASGIGQASSVIPRQTAGALLAYVQAMHKRQGREKKDMSVVSQTVVFREEDPFQIDFSDTHAYPEYGDTIWKRLLAQVISMPIDPPQKMRSIGLKLMGSANYLNGQVGLRLSLLEERNDPNDRDKTVDQRQTATQISVEVGEDDVFMIANSGFVSGRDMQTPRGRVILLTAYRTSSIPAPTAPRVR